MKPPLKVGWGLAETPPKVPSRGYATPYREEKIAAHTTKGGKGKVARVLRRRK